MTIRIKCERLTQSQWNDPLDFKGCGKYRKHRNHKVRTVKSHQCDEGEGRCIDTFDVISDGNVSRRLSEYRDMMGEGNDS